MTITSAQCREGRRLLGWSSDRMAAKAGLSGPTVLSCESGHRKTYARTLSAIRAALEAAGVDLIAENGGAGVRLKKDPSAATTPPGFAESMGAALQSLSDRPDTDKGE